MTYSISGKTVFITGGARGIGAETARRLAAKGARVALAGLEPEELEKVAAQCGPDAIWFETDVTDWDALERAVSGTVERFGGSTWCWPTRASPRRAGAVDRSRRRSSA